MIINKNEEKRIWVYGGATEYEAYLTFKKILYILDFNDIPYRAYKYNYTIITKNVTTKVVALNSQNEEKKLMGVLIDEAFNFGFATRLHLTGKISQYRGNWLDYIIENAK